MIAKGETIDAIRKLNPSANRDFLSRFEPADLQAYLSRLSARRSSTHVDTACKNRTPNRSSPLRLP